MGQPRILSIWAMKGRNPMPNNNVATICELGALGMKDLILGYRWMFKSKAFTMVSNTVFSRKYDCKKSLIQFMDKHKFDYWDITFKEKTQKSQTFRV